MAKDSYDIDEILSEIKQHKEQKGLKIDQNSKKTDSNSQTGNTEKTNMKNTTDHQGEMKVGLYDIIQEAEKKEKMALEEEKLAEQSNKSANKAKDKTNSPPEKVNETPFLKPEKKITPNAKISFNTEDLTFKDVPNTTQKVETDNMEFNEIFEERKETDSVDKLVFEENGEQENINQQIGEENPYDGKGMDTEKACNEVDKKDREENVTENDENIKENENASKLDSSEKTKEDENVDAYSMADVLAIRDNFNKENEENNDLTENVNKKKEKSPKKDRFRYTKRGKIVISIICSLLAMIVATTSLGAWYVNDKLNGITDRDDSTKDFVSGFSDMEKLVENFDLIYEENAYNIYSYKDMVKKWYLNGKPCSSSRVLNILLIGQDTTDSEATSRADSAIICSVNVDTKTITLTSILRDTYVYWQKDGQDRYNKITEICAVGGLGAYISAVENCYKIEIDNYATVNFDTFPKIVDKLGGIIIEMTQREINEINSHPKRYLYPDKITYNSADLTYDEQSNSYVVPINCNGSQALAYSRIRKIDSDNARVNRQKTVLLKIFNKMKKSSSKELLSTATTLMGYVKTGYSKTDILNIGKYAIKKEWLNFQVVTQTIPSDDCSVGGKGSSFFNTWCWKADLPMDSYNLQMSIYGKTNVVLADPRADFATISAS